MSARMPDISENDIENKWVSEKKTWDSAEKYIEFLKQKKAYQFAGAYCRDKDVLDYGCGSGYGASLLATNAKRVIGVDINRDVIEYCQKKRIADNLSFGLINIDGPLPFKDKTFDIITSFQVIEHIADVQFYLSQFKRVLKDEGALFISTPNRRYRLLPFQRPWNLEHLREYSLRGLRKELLKIFSKVEILALCGIGEVDRIERQKAKTFSASVIKSDIEKLSRKLMKALLPESITRYIKKTRNQNETQTRNSPAYPILDFYKRYNLSDFVVGTNLARALDFIAVCRK